MPTPEDMQRDLDAMGERTRATTEALSGLSAMLAATVKAGRESMLSSRRPAGGSAGTAENPPPLPTAPPPLPSVPPPLDPAMLAAAAAADLLATNLKNAADQSAAAAARWATPPSRVGSATPEAPPDDTRPAWEEANNAALEAAKALHETASAAATAAHATSAAGPTADEMKRAGDAGTEFKPAAPAAEGEAAGGGMGGAMAALGGVAGAAMMAGKALAGIPAMIAPFVQAINPTLVEQFGVAMRDVNAAIGVAVEGVMAVALGVVRDINAIITPLMQALKPVITGLVADMAQRLMPVLKLVVEAFTALMPVFAILHEVMRPIEAVLPAVANLMRLWVAVLSGVMASMGDVLSPLKDVMDNVVDAMKQAVRAVIVFAAQLAQFLGMSKVVDAIKAAFGEKKTDVTKATIPAQISDFASILRDATVSAFTAQGTEGPQTTEDWLGNIHALLKDALADKDALASMLADAIANVFDKLGIKVTQKDITAIKDAIVSARNAAASVPTPGDVVRSLPSAPLTPGAAARRAFNWARDQFRGE